MVRINIGIWFGLFAVIQFYTKFKRSGQEVKNMQDPPLLRVRNIIITPLFFLVICRYIFYPGSFGWANVPLSDWIQMAGIIVFNASAIMRLHTYYVLGMHWSDREQVLTRHQLVDKGLYRWIRHPLYALNFPTAISFFAVTENWFLGMVGLIMALITVKRVGSEEENLLKALGEKYAAYKQRTGRFFPRL